MSEAKLPSLFTAAFVADESGAGTAWWALWMIIFLMFGGVAADSSNAWRMRAELQATADAAAHAGSIDLPDKSGAIASADAMAASNMDSAEHGDVLFASEIEVGQWDGDAAEFDPNAGSGFGAGGAGVYDAIRVTTRRDVSNSNRLKTYFLRLVGMDSWNVNARAVAQRYWPECLNEDALIARRVVDLQSNNVFRNGLCVHGNDHVEVNNNNTWDEGVKVTMPNLADLAIPSSDIATHNPGLADALGEEWFDPKIVDQVHPIIDSLLDPSSPNIPSYIGTDADGAAIDQEDIVQTYSSQQFSAGVAVPGYIYYVTCPGNSLLNLGNNVVLEKVIIVTECRLATGNNSLYENVILASYAGDKPNESQYSKSINIGQGNQFGTNDNCSTDGNAKLFSGGTIKSAADLQMYGVQAVAVWDIQLAAQAGGMEGIQLLAGNDVDITSNNAFGGGCTGGVDPILVPYYRLVM